MITVSLAAISYAWLEAPFLRLNARFSGVPGRRSVRIRAVGPVAWRLIASGYGLPAPVAT